MSKQDKPRAWLYVEDPWGANEHHFMTDSPESQHCDPRDWTPLYEAPPPALVQVLEQIDLKAQAGLCYFTLESARAFLQDIRKIISAATQGSKP